MTDYKEELAKLYAIINKSTTVFIARSYVKEKLDMALFGDGIGLHPSLEPVVKKLLKEVENG